MIELEEGLARLESYGVDTERLVQRLMLGAPPMLELQQMGLEGVASLRILADPQVQSVLQAARYVQRLNTLAILYQRMLKGSDRAGAVLLSQVDEPGALQQPDESLEVGLALHDLEERILKDTEALLDDGDREVF